MVQQALVETPRTPHPRALLVGREGHSTVCTYLTHREQLEFKGDLTVETDPLAHLSEHPPAKIDLLIGLDKFSTAFENLLTPNGVFLLNESGIHPPPERRDIDTVIIPASALARSIIGWSEPQVDKQLRSEVEECVMLGATLALNSSPPPLGETGILRNLPKCHRKALLRLALCRGYDWIQEKMLRGKSLDLEA